MKKIFLTTLVVSLVACGPRVRDKDSSPPDGNSTPNNAAANAGTNVENGGTQNNGAMNGVTPNNATLNNAATNNGTPNNGTPNNGTPNNNTGNNTTSNNNTATNNGTGNNTTSNNNTGNNTTNNNSPDPVQQKCDDFCELVWGSCITNNCTLSADVDSTRSDILDECKGVTNSADSCPNRYRNDPDYASNVDAFVAQGCNGDDTRYHRCTTFGTDVCNCPLPDVGGACTTDADCTDPGVLVPFCLAEEADGNVPGGQCLAGGCAFGDAQPGELLVGAATGCGDDPCYVIDENNSACLPGCQQNSDCDRHVTGPNQSGYSCVLFGKLDVNGVLTPLGICQTACSDDADCDTGVCSSSWVCEMPCMTDADCPADFACTGTSPSGKTHCELEP